MRTTLIRSIVAAVGALVVVMVSAGPAAGQYEPDPPPPPGTVTTHTDECGIPIVGSPGARVTATFPGVPAGTAYELIYTYPPNVWDRVGDGVSDHDPLLARFTIPMAAQAGEAAITAQATDGTGISVTCPVTVAVTTGGVLPRTGFDTTLALRVAAAAIGLGGLLAVAARRRPNG